MKTFLERLLPSEGYYCVAKLLPSGAFAPFFHDSLDAACQRLATLDKDTNNIFIAQATFLTPDNRKQINVCKLKSFWVDIDCGKGKPYEIGRAHV